MKVEDEARQLEAAGDLVGAGRAYERAGMLGPAVRCFFVAKDMKRALAVLLKFPQGDSSYGRAAALALEACTAIGRFDFEVHQFLGPFLARTPKTEEEIIAFYRAGVLLDGADMLEEAKLALAKVEECRPGFSDTRARLADLAKRARGAPETFARVLREDAAFEKAARASPARAQDSETFPSLPELPPMPARRGAPPAPPQPYDRERSETVASRASSIPPGTRSTPPPSSVARPTPAANRVEALLQDVRNVPKGMVVADRYQIRELVGHGGMAAVYEALDLELGETIAIKIFVPSANVEMLSRFRQEVSLARQISHPNVVRLYDLGAHGSTRFITMELLRGKDLADKVVADGRDLLRDLDYLVQACRGVACVHDRGAVHRDLKPENLFVCEDGVVKLMDFGIAKRNKTEGNLTQAGFSAGTPAFMAPEQIQSFGSVTHLSDLYSLGVIGYYLFTGVLPFDADNNMALLIKHLNEPPPPPSHHEPNIPEELEFIILQLLEKTPSRRIQSCAELASDLDSLRQRLQATKRRRA